MNRLSHSVMTCSEYLCICHCLSELLCECVWRGDINYTYIDVHKEFCLVFTFIHIYIHINDWIDRQRGRREWMNTPFLKENGILVVEDILCYKFHNKRHGPSPKFWNRICCFDHPSNLHSYLHTYINYKITLKKSAAQEIKYLTFIDFSSKATNTDKKTQGVQD